MCDDRRRMSEEQVFQLDGRYDGDRMSVEISAAELREQLVVQGFRIVFVPTGMETVTPGPLAKRQDKAIAALAFSKDTTLQEAADAIGVVMATAVDAIKDFLEKTKK